MTTVTSTCTACGATYRGRLQQCPNCGKAISSADLPELRPGDVVDGKYEIVSLLGVGGMGQVFKARHVHLNTFRTVKVMRRNLLIDEANRNRFVREARLATLVHHQNVAVVHDFSTLPDGTHYMVSEFIDGVTIRQWSKQHGRFSVPLALRIALQVLSGLENIHRAGLLHRDISADNIMIAASDDGEPIAKIIDLGIAKQLAGATMSEATQVGLFVGNPRYSSPEQLGALADGEEIDGRADVYCFGIVLYEMIAGAPPFVSNTPHGYAVKHLTELPPPLSAHLDPGAIPAGLQQVVFKALEKQRKKRYASAREFGLALAPFATDSISPTVQAKIDSLRSRPTTPTLAIPHQATEIPPTLTPPPVKEEDEDEAWREAARARSKEAFQKFLNQFPSGIYATAARARLAELELLGEVNRMADRGDVSGLQKLAHAHTSESPMGRAVRSALESAIQRRAAAVEEEWQEATRRNGREPFQRFLRLYPDSPHADEARARLAEVDILDEVEALARRGDAEGLKTIADANLTNARITSAALGAFNRLADAQRRRVEAEQDESWRTATRDGSREAFQKFLIAYPEGIHALEARARIEELDLLVEIESLARRGDLHGLRRLAEAHGRDAPVAGALRTTIERLEEEERRRRAAEQEDAWKAALADGSRQAFDAFLRQHPEGIHALEARKKIDDIDLHAEIDRMTQRGDLAGLRSLAETQAGDSATGRKLRRSLDVLEEEERRRNAEQEEAWKRAAHDGSRAAYEAFLRQYPKGIHADDARGRIDEIELHAEIDRLAERGDLHALRALADVHAGDGTTSRRVRFAVEKLETEMRRRRAVEQEEAWREVERQGSRTALRQFLQSYPDAPHAPEARLQLAEFDVIDEIARLESNGDTAALRRLAESQRPESRPGAAAREALDRLADQARQRRLAEEEQARQRMLAEEDERDFNGAMQSGTEHGWRSYLEKHPDSPRAPRARKMLDEVRAFESALEENSSTAWRAFIQAWPDSRFRANAEQRLHSAEEILASHDYAIAVRADTPDAYNAFITQHPNSPLAVEAKRRWSVITDLSLARRADTGSVWREVLARHPDEPMMAEGRTRLQDIEESLRREFDAALSSRSVASLRAMLQRDPSPFTSELARRGLDEINALQAAIRSSSVDALRRFAKSFSDGHFITTCEYLLGKYEETAFSGLVQSRSRARAVRFMTDFPTSSKIANVRRLLAGIDETETFNQAIRELRRGNFRPSEDALGRIGDSQLRNLLRAEVEKYARSSRMTKLKVLLDYMISRAGDQLRGGTAKEASPETWAAGAELRAVKDAVLEELKELAGILKPEAQRFADAQPTPVPAPQPLAIAPAPRPQRLAAAPPDEHPPVPTVAKKSSWKRRFATAAVLLAAVVVLGGMLLWIVDRERAVELGETGQGVIRRITGRPDPDGRLGIDAFPWGRIDSIRPINGNGAEVIGVDDVAYTPASFSLAPGLYLVKVTGPDGKADSRSVEIRPKKETSVRFPFASLEASEYFSQLR